MTNSIDNEFNKNPSPIEKKEDQSSNQIQDRLEAKYDEPHLTYEMSGEDGDTVRAKEFEKRQAELWMNNYQQRPKLDQQDSNIELSQGFKETAAKPLSVSFFDSLSDENKAKIEAYKQAHPEQKPEQQNQKKGYGSSDL